MRNTVALSVRQYGLNLIYRQRKLLCDLGGGYTVVEILDNRVRWHPSAEQRGFAAESGRSGFDQRTFGPIDFVNCGHRYPPLR